ncbi:MAG: hypothetical protein GC180_10805 [Bacteroidetes bacterium]|nr:hypothetical protein [Bacteroidota bacterium]
MKKVKDDALKEDQPDHPTNGSSEEIFEESKIPTDTENMEVHHHAHDPAAPHHKKNWKSYFWEFMMLFLAVFCGFLAEWQLEHVIEHSREKEFIRTMVEDAQIDTFNIERVLKNNKKTLVYVDSLANACYNYEEGSSSDFDIYRLYRHLLSALEGLKPTERTIIQLNNSGGMRLIRNGASVDKIISYEACEKEVTEQQEVVNKLKYEFANASYELFNYSYFNLESKSILSPDAKLLLHDKLKLTRFANRISIYGGVLTKYNFELLTMKEKALEVIHTLNKSYHLEHK